MKYTARPPPKNVSRETFQKKQSKGFKPMVKFQMRGEIIATRTTKKGKHIVSLWDYDRGHLPVNGMFSPLNPDAVPDSGEGIYLIVTHNNFTTITPLIIDRKEKNE